MRSRDLIGGRSIYLPTADADDLVSQPAVFNEVFDFESALLDGDDQAGAVGEGTVAKSVVRGVNLSGAKLGPLVLADSVLRAVDLSNASLQRVVVRRTEWHTCRAIGLRLSVENATDFSVQDCGFDYATLHIEKVKGVAVFTGCSFRETTISGDLSNVLFLDCDFVETEFRAKRAAKCDLRGSRLTSARGLLTLRGATISTDQAVSISALIATEAGLIVAD